MRGLWLFGILGVFCLQSFLAPRAVRGQEPAVPSAQPDTAARPATPATPNSGKTRYSHANDFLIRGTVFNEKAMAFSSVELRVRRLGEKKFHWQGYTNSRGEFAIRVPKGAEYEMVVSSKGFKDQAHKFDAKNGLDEESASFRMEPIVGEKK